MVRLDTVRFYVDSWSDLQLQLDCLLDLVIWCSKSESRMELFLRFGENIDYSRLHDAIVILPKTLT